MHARSHFSHVWLFATLRTVAVQASLSMGLSRQEYRSGLPFSPPGDFPHQGWNPALLKISCIGRWILYHCHLGSPWSICSLEIWFSSRLCDCTSVTQIHHTKESGLVIRWESCHSLLFNTDQQGLSYVFIIFEAVLSHKPQCGILKVDTAWEQGLTRVLGV